MKKLSLSKLKKIALWKKLLLLLLGMGVLILPSVIQEIKWRNNKLDTVKTGAAQETKIGNDTKAQRPGSNMDQTVSTSGGDQSTSNAGGKDFNVSVTCKDISVTREIEYENDPGMYVGETRTWPGRDGLKRVCTRVKDGKDWGKYRNETSTETDWITRPFTETVYRGTKQNQPTQPVTPTYTYQQALQMAQNQCSPIAQASGTSSSAYQSCLQAALGNYGY